MGVWSRRVSIGERLEERARLANLPLDVVQALPEIARTVADAMGDDLLEPLATQLASRAPADAVAAVRAADLESRFGVTASRRAYLLLALSQFEAARARHQATGVRPEISLSTLSDLGIWVRQFQAQAGTIGITLEILDWSQRYLRGELFRLGALQFELRPFGGPITAHRHRVTGVARLAWHEGGRDADEIDVRAGVRTGIPFVAHPDEVRVLDPASRVLDLHVPAGVRLGVSTLVDSIRDARAFFAGRAPELEPVGMSGEAWLLDPQVKILLPRSRGVHALQDACLLYPSKLTEEKTIRRLFGPDVRRDMLASLPRERMTSFHRAVVDFLSDPQVHLRARGGVLLWPEHDAALARFARAPSA